MNFETWLQSDLTKPLKVQALHGVFFSADNAANLIGVEVFDGGTAAALSGTCIGYAIRADGGTLPITGAVSGNKASIILPTSAYVIEGPLDIVIKVVSGSVKTTVGACRGYVQRATTDTIIDPGHVIPSLEELLALIEPMEEATDAANAAASSANNAASNANSKAAAANTAAQSANTAASTANTAAANATTAAEAANAAAAAAPTQANTEIKYQASVSGDTIPTGQWLDTIPSVPQGSWLWVRTIISWDNGEVSDPIYTKARSGIDGSGSVVSVNGISPDANGNVALPVDTAPTQDSQNPVTSGGAYTALSGKQNTLTFDTTPTSDSTNPVTSGGVYSAEQSIRNTVSIVATGNTAPKAITAGEFVQWQGALYTATTNIPSGGTLSTSNLQAKPNGGLNALKSSVDALNSNKTDFEVGIFSAVFPRDTVSNYYGTWLRIGRILFITAQWTNVHNSGSGTSYIEASSLPTPTGYRRNYGFHGNWMSNTTDKQGGVGQYSENTSMRFENAGNVFALPDEPISLNAWCLLIPD